MTVDVLGLESTAKADQGDMPRSGETLTLDDAKHTLLAAEAKAACLDRKRFVVGTGYLDLPT